MGIQTIFFIVLIFLVVSYMMTSFKKYDPYSDAIKLTKEEQLIKYPDVNYY